MSRTELLLIFNYSILPRLRLLHTPWNKTNERVGGALSVGGHTSICRSHVSSNLNQGVRKKAAADSEDDEDRPLQYFGSQAASWQAFTTRSGPVQEQLWYQPYVILVSLGTFMIYFCVLREENDIDRRLEGNLFEQVPGLERTQLIIYYKYCRDQGLDTREVEQRLQEMGVNVDDLKNIA